MNPQIISQKELDPIHKKLKIRYKKKRLNLYLLMIIVWTLLGIFNLFFGNFDEWTTYIWVVLPIMNIAMYSYEYMNQYLTIENGQIYKNSLFSKKINLTEIKRIKKFAGDYILKTEKTELTINTQIIDPNSLAELNVELEKLNLE